MKAAVTTNMVQAQRVTMNLCSPNFYWEKQQLAADAEVRHVASQERSDVRDKDKADAAVK